MAEKIAVVENLLSCYLCSETFRDPVSLSCSHSFCSSCLQKFWEQTKNKNCPVCKRRSSKDDPSVNLSLKELADELKMSPSETPSVMETERKKKRDEVLCDLFLPAKESASSFSEKFTFGQSFEDLLLQIGQFLFLVCSQNFCRQLEQKLWLQLRDTGSLKTFGDPVSLSCSHSFCSSCLQKFWEQTKNKNCPICKRRSSKDFPPVNFSLKELADSLAGRKKSPEGENRENVSMGFSSGRHSWEVEVGDHPAWRVGLVKESVDRKGELYASPKYGIWSLWHGDGNYSCAGETVTVKKSLQRIRVQLDYDMGEVSFYNSEDMTPIYTHRDTFTEKLFPFLGLKTLKPLISKSVKFVRCGDTKQKLPENPERNINYNTVFGSEGFSSGTHSWEVEVGDHPRWNVGLVKESVNRKGKRSASPEYGVWFLLHDNGKYTNGAGKTVTVKKSLQRIRVQLDYDMGEVSFYNSEDMTHIYTHRDTFTEKLFPYFNLHFSPVILDPNTAHGILYLSDDLTSVRCGDTEQKLPENPERNIMYTSVFGSEGFSSGTHSWEVEVGDHPEWRAGLVKESVDRKGKLYLSPEYGFWCLLHGDGEYTNGAGKTVTVRKSLQRIRVQLDYDMGEVSFYNSEDMTHIYTHRDTFTEKLFPYFSVGPAKDAKTSDIKIC
ncbi:unnamed protein product [Menidia menidia]|uniref:(Atlantic silverside) hypothetical protein n=1 Tax=Menidia menidia TaxID=238744 RepID=A0A8S4AZE5_9TELE|nr:unnamed protein product [Menidia menidia]